MLLILGSGGHASVLVDILYQQKIKVDGLVSPEVIQQRKALVGLSQYQDADVLGFDKGKVTLINGIGSLPGCNLRRKLFNEYKALGYDFGRVIATSAIISPYAEIGMGVQIMSGAIIQAGAIVGDNTIVNTGAIIEHDCKIGAQNHIAPGVTLSGGVETASNVHIGSGASIIQLIKIGENAVVGAGSTIVKDVADNIICFPARITEKALEKHES